eukprot:138266-Pyramimonas_sp.AAC.1
MLDWGSGGGMEGSDYSEPFSLAGALTRRWASDAKSDVSTYLPETPLTIDGMRQHFSLSDVFPPPPHHPPLLVVFTSSAVALAPRRSTLPTSSSPSLLVAPIPRIRTGPTG